MADKDILLVTAPKSGSHMLADALQLRAFQPWMKKGAGLDRHSIAATAENVVDGPGRGWAHLPGYRPIVTRATHVYKIVFALRRDPRDIAVSLAHWLEKNVAKQGPVDYFVSGVYLSDLSFRNRLMAIIELFGSTYAYYHRWYKHHAVYQVWYEDLVADREAQIYRINHLAKKHGVEPNASVDEMVYLSKQGDNVAYRTGASGNWIDEFDDDHHRAAREYLTGIMDLWGYRWD